MKKLFRVFVTLLLLGGWGLAASALHVVRSPSGIVVIPKDRLSAKDTYVDVTKWDAAAAEAHASVVQRLVETNHADTLSHVDVAPVKQAAADDQAVAL
jgi:hypothetical protein